MKCIKCLTKPKSDEGEQVINEADCIYHGFSLCIFHFRDWHSLVMKEVKDGRSPIIKP